MLVRSIHCCKQATSHSLRMFVCLFNAQLNFGTTWTCHLTVQCTQSYSYPSLYGRWCRRSGRSKHWRLQLSSRKPEDSLRSSESSVRQSTRAWLAPISNKRTRYALLFCASEANSVWRYVSILLLLLLSLNIQRKHRSCSHHIALFKTYDTSFMTVGPSGNLSFVEFEQDSNTMFELYIRPMSTLYNTFDRLTAHSFRFVIGTSFGLVSRIIYLYVELCKTLTSVDIYMTSNATRVVDRKWKKSRLLGQLFQQKDRCKKYRVPTSV